MKTCEKFKCSCGGAVYIELNDTAEKREIPCPKCYLETYKTNYFDPVFNEEKGCEVYTRMETEQVIVGKKITCVPGQGEKVTLSDNGVEA